MRLNISLVLFLFISANIWGQVSINSTGAAPDRNSMLDVSSSSKGILIPRMTTGERDLMGEPTTGMMIFNSTTNTFNYWNGSAWIAILSGNIKELSDADNDTKVQVEKNADED